MTAIPPTPAPNVELELAKLANDAMSSGADPHDVTNKLHQTISYLRQFPQMAQHATNALADGVASPADISRTLWPHVQAMSHANGAPGVSNTPTPQEAASLPGDVTPRSRLGGGLASFGIPGVEPIATAGHAILSGQSYPAAYKDVKAAEATSPIRTPLKIAGGIVGTMGMPGGPALSAAREGLASGVLDANPDTPLDQRLKSGAINAGVNAAFAGAADKAITGVRAIRAAAPAANVVARNARMGAADAANYGAAAQEGTDAVANNHPALPDLTQKLNDPDIKPFADMVRSARQFAGADEPTVAREAFKLMTKQQGGLARRLSEQGFDAATQLQHDNIGLAKDDLMTAAKQVMPSFETAVDAHADAAGLRDAVQRGADVSRRVINNTQLAGRNLGTKSPEAFAAKIPTMPAANAAATAEGVLGQAGQNIGLTANPRTVFGVVPSMKATRVAPLVQQLDQRAGKTLPNLMRNVGVQGADEILRNLGVIP